MKIEKTNIGSIILKTASDEIEHIIATDVFIQKHPRNDNAILISKTPTNQDENESIILFSDAVTEVNRVEFSGNRNDLLIKLSELFRNGGGGGVGSLFPVTGEESGRLINGGFQYGYGNGYEAPQGRGVTLAFDCELVALSLNIKFIRTLVSVEAYKDTTATGKVVEVSDNFRGVLNFSDDPVFYPAGSTIGFRTVIAGGAVTGVVTAWFLAKQVLQL